MIASLSCHQVSLASLSRCEPRLGRGAEARTGRRAGRWVGRRGPAPWGT